ncbi:MAG TPA: DNA replication and repair protein RecF [Candidatus Saccharimonadales bacterium]|nr:DNA replication and repair protein RecF [Candidatus Saccharimonadales bacterium]
MLTDIRLQHFRSYADTSFELSPGVNIIVGPNASGKTNLLEAILVLARGNSYRAESADLLRFGQDWARLDAHTADGQTRTLKLQTTPALSKKFEVDGQTILRLTPAKSIPAVLFEPNHLLLLTGAPESRRSFLDDLIEQTEPGFGTVRRHYRRVLAQRNALLKSGRATPEQLFVWNIRLSELGGQLVKRRLAMLDTLNAELSSLYSELAQRPSDVRLTYVAKLPTATYESALLHKLEADFELDRLRGFTGAGPHRDDIAALLGDHPLQDSASRGETRTLVLALKILETKLLEQAHTRKPILLLDDVFSELDGKRRQALTDFLRDYQTFITTTDADVVIQHFTNKANIIPMDAA